MCGIVGITGNDFSKINLSNVIDTLSHRGPDDKGFELIDDLVFLGHTRLSVIDLSPLGHQPMSNESKTVWITYNGEIYNFQEIRAELEKKGYRFKSKSDTEVILHLYEEKGESCVNDLNGMFAFAIYDKQKQKMLLARDRLGIKPLYYALQNSKFIFASEIKAILATNLIKKEINYQAIDNYFSFLFVPCPETAFNSIKQIPPAHFLSLDLKSMNFKLQQYWTPLQDKPFQGSYDDLQSELKFLLNDSVKSQLVSDVPIGVFLSGGIDSSILANLASKNSSSRLKTYTTVFKGNDFKLYDESEAARKISRLIGSEHTEIEIENPSPEAILDLITCFDQPFANPTFYLSYLISKATKKHVTVALSGVGGDELFGGYPRYKALPYAKFLRIFPGVFNKLFTEITNLIPESATSHFPRRIKLLARGIGVPLAEQYLRWSYYLSDDQKKSLLEPTFSRNALLIKSTNIINSYLSEVSSRDILNRIQYVDLNTFLLDNLLEYTDKTSMAHGLEIRVPYLDHRIVELSFKIPQKYKIHGKKSKYILKESFKDFLPEEVLNSPKKGFCAPMSIWINEHFDYYFDNLLTCDYLKKQGIMDWDTIQLLRKHHKMKIRDNSMELFGIIMFDSWYKKYFN